MTDLTITRPPFSANISFLYPEIPFLDRFAAAKASGFEIVELHFPTDYPLALLQETRDAAGVSILGINTAPGDRERGEWGLAGIPGREGEFRQQFDDALRYAVGLGAKTIHVMAGIVPAHMLSAAEDCYIANLKAVAPLAAAEGITLLLEPLNSYDVPGYIVARSDEAVALIQRVNEPNLKLMFDIYHVQIMEGDLTRRLRNHFEHIGHIQIASVPNRHEPDEGEVNMRHIFETLADLGWNRPVGLEYRPRAGTQEGLRWLTRMGLATPVLS